MLRKNPPPPETYVRSGRCQVDAASACLCATIEERNSAKRRRHRGGRGVTPATSVKFSFSATTARLSRAIEILEALCNLCPGQRQRAGRLTVVEAPRIEQRDGLIGGVVA